jgi:protein-disulfide isomerase
MREVLQKYEGEVRLVYRDFPLQMHANALPAALAGECAHEQGKFWEYHDLLFANQAQMDEASLRDYAAQAGLDTDSFGECLSSQKYLEEVQKDYSDGVSYGVSGTPAFFVNDVLVSGAQPIEAFSAVIDQELAE